MEEQKQEMTNLGILADDAIRAAFIEECKRQNEWKDKVDAIAASNAKLRKK